MSRIAGRLAPLVGAQALTSEGGGAGVLLPGVDDVPGASVVVIGAGNVGGEAVRVAARMGARVTLVSRGAGRRDAVATDLAAEGHSIIAFGLANASDGRFADAVAAADLVIGGVLEPGTLSPKLISLALVAAMRPGSVIVDVGIDHGGIAETSRMTKQSDPTYIECGVVHYAVPNMPALVARTATLALAQATLPAVRAMAGKGIAAALANDAGLAAGVMCAKARLSTPDLPPMRPPTPTLRAPHDEGIRLRRLVRQRQDHADRTADSASRRPRRNRIAGQARASRIRP